MQIGLYANTHGQASRDDTDIFLMQTPVDQMRPVQVAELAEAQGFHSLWFPDHVCMTIDSDSFHTANQSGTRAYQPRHNMLDAAVCMGAVAVRTSRLKLGTSCLISPYRDPLSDARQFMTVDQLSGGRLMLGVAAGWMQEEYAAVGIPFEERNGRLKECIEIYKASWTDEVVAYDGEFYRFANVSMDPKPVTRPHPPIVYGGNTPFGARRAIRHCTGFYPLFLDAHAEPERFAPLQDEIRREAEKLSRDPAGFTMTCAASARITDAGDPQSEERPRRTCTGTAEQVLEDLERFANAGYSLVVCMFECPSGELAELEDQIRRFGAEVIPEARKFKPAGEWLQVD